MQPSPSTIIDPTENLDLLCCPGCGSDLVQKHAACLACADCHKQYDYADNIPLLFWADDSEISKNKVGESVKQFYERTPFPDYDDFDSVATLVEKSRLGVFAKLLDEQIPFGVRIIECGCGTGQLSNFLSIANRKVIGTDYCINSLKLAQSFKEKNNLQRVHFYQMNLFHPCFKPEKFDLVICNGVLHHTADPSGGFKSISRLVKPGGYIGRALSQIWPVVHRLAPPDFSSHG